VKVGPGSPLRGVRDDIEGGEAAFVRFVRYVVRFLGPALAVKA
jgi:hypothetical protein